jgi:hypothetical protein
MTLFGIGWFGIVWIGLDAHGIQGRVTAITMSVAMAVGGGLWIWYFFLRDRPDDIEG